MATPMDRELTCKELVDLVTDYLEQRLSAPDRARFDEHLAACPYCTTYLEQMRQTVRTLGCLPEDSIPPAALDELLGHFKRWR
jgi:anti-sigma factor RsiW